MQFYFAPLPPSLPHLKTKGSPGLYAIHKFLMVIFPSDGQPVGGRLSSIMEGASDGTSLYSWMRSTAGGREGGRKGE